MGIYGALSSAVTGLQGPGARAGEHLGQYRELADHGLQADRDRLPRSDPGCAAAPPGAGRGAGAVARHQRRAGRHQDGVERDVHRAQLPTASSWLSRKLRPGGRRSDLFAGTNLLHPPRRLRDRQGRPAWSMAPATTSRACRSIPGTGNVSRARCPKCCSSDQRVPAGAARRSRINYQANLPQLPKPERLQGDRAGQRVAARR
jgi:hypothetical protein